jgi:hypothetical protein
VTAPTARLLFPETDGEVMFRLGSLNEANLLLSIAHYLGPIGAARHVFIAIQRDQLVAVQVWRWPTARHLPSDGSWLELSRWCLTPDAGKNAGSKMHAYCVKWLRKHESTVKTLVSYSDPSQGHTGALYKACNWQWAPTWLRLSPPPSGNGNWGTNKVQHVKDRWIFRLGRDAQTDSVLAISQANARQAVSA